MAAWGCQESHQEPLHAALAAREPEEEGEVQSTAKAAKEPGCQARRRTAATCDLGHLRGCLVVLASGGSVLCGWGVPPDDGPLGLGSASASGIP